MFKNPSYGAVLRSETLTVLSEVRLVSPRSDALSEALLATLYRGLFLGFLVSSSVSGGGGHG